MTRSFVVPLALAASVASTLFFSASTASAAEPWVDRRLTLPTHDWAFDLALGIGHRETPIVTPFGNTTRSVTGPGLNLELAVSVIHHLELGFRTGVRFGDDARFASADYYGRMYDRQSFALGGGTMANPEARVRGELIDLEIIELALEGRVVLPFDPGSRAGLLMGVPLAFHLGTIARLDTGVFIPVVFADPTVAAFNLPLDAWFQVSNKLWLGPMTGVRVGTNTGAPTDISMGFGLGYSVASFVDLKTMVLVPDINHSPIFRAVGVGIGVQIRIE
jgi:hypothetical protein